MLHELVKRASVARLIFFFLLDAAQTRSRFLFVCNSNNGYEYSSIIPYILRHVSLFPVNIHMKSSTVHRFLCSAVVLQGPMKVCGVFHLVSDKKKKRQRDIQRPHIQDIFTHLFFTQDSSGAAFHDQLCNKNLQSRKRHI